MLGLGILVADIQDAFYALATKKDGCGCVVRVCCLQWATRYPITSLVPLNKLIDNTCKIAGMATFAYV
ncbi:hypothetical protein O9992_19015 [Vibrio lentus]|nr:hypothetical protein [Vibrio lentus]